MILDHGRVASESVEKPGGTDRSGMALARVHA